LCFQLNSVCLCAFTVSAVCILRIVYVKELYLVRCDIISIGGEESEFPYGGYRCVFTSQHDVTANKKRSVIVTTLRISGRILLVSHISVKVKNSENPSSVHIFSLVFIHVLKAVC
jgi:hypothetical protein